MGEERNIGSESRSDAVRVGRKAIALEHHPHDSRIKIAEDGICQTLNKRMGTGGGNVPLVLITDDESVCRKEIL